jgi:hypothetical protein
MRHAISTSNSNGRKQFTKRARTVYQFATQVLYFSTKMSRANNDPLKDQLVKISVLQQPKSKESFVFVILLTL